MSKRSGITKVVDFKGRVRCASGSYGVIREEVYADSQARVTKYNLAFIHFGLFQRDHGRVLGYDNAHGVHERHWMGRTEPVDFESYTATLERFEAEVRELRRTA